MYCLELQWHEFNVNVAMVRTWLIANVNEECVNLSANSKLQLYFESEPSQEDQAAIQAYWDGLTDQSDEATSYQTAEQIKAAVDADRAAKLASARTKLEGLGLTADEVSAILGQ